MALPTTTQLSNQMMNETVRDMPTSAMDGNVTRPMIIKDLISAMKDVNFSQLVEEYGSMAGLPRADATPMTKSLMEKMYCSLNTKAAYSPKEQSILQLCTTHLQPHRPMPNLFLRYHQYLT